jgi:hypothetical protein
MEFMTSADAFREQMEIIDSMFSRERRLPQPVFKERLEYPLFTDSDAILFPSYFERLKAFVVESGDDKFFLAAVDPDPKEYFYERSGKYPIVQLGVQDTAEEYLELLHHDLGEAGALAYNGRVILFYSESRRWGINVDQDLELGVAGFVSERLNEVFTSVYGSERVFTAESAIDELLYAVFIHNPEGVPSDIREQLIRNYMDKKS